jgi:hypothetical protein
MFVFLFAHTVTVFVDDAAITPTPLPTVTPAKTPTRSNIPADRRELDLSLGLAAIWHPRSLGPPGERVPKNSVLRSKHLLKPQPLPHQHWGSELRTSLYHPINKIVLEVEAGRGVTNYQFLKDLFQACVMQDVDYLAIAVRQDYRGSKDYEKVVTFIETIFASDRLKLPLNAVLIIGY